MDKLHFFEADLSKDAGWNEAVMDCTYVLHVASPFPLLEPEDENELIIPARDGALRVLKASKEADVKRVVLTSSFAAVGYGIAPTGYIFSEKDWTDENAPIRPYIKSKTIAEKAAWDFIKESGGNMELTVINPVGIFGPIIGGIIPASYDGVIKAIIDGTITESPAVTFGIVDVRDVAWLHIQAMLNPKANGERFIATADGVVSYSDIAQIIRTERPELSGKICDLKPVDEDVYIHIDNQKAKAFFNWLPISKKEAILASVDLAKTMPPTLPNIL